MRGSSTVRAGHFPTNGRASQRDNRETLNKRARFLVIPPEVGALDLRAADPDALGAFFALADLAKMTINWQLVEPQAGEERYRLAGR